MACLFLHAKQKAVLDMKKKALRPPIFPWCISAFGVMMIFTRVELPNAFPTFVYARSVPRPVCVYGWLWSRESCVCMQKCLHTDSWSSRYHNTGGFAHKQKPNQHRRNEWPKNIEFIKSWMTWGFLFHLLFFFLLLFSLLLYIVWSSKCST